MKRKLSAIVLFAIIAFVVTPIVLLILDGVLSPELYEFILPLVHISIATLLFMLVFYLYEKREEGDNWFGSDIFVNHSWLDHKQEKGENDLHVCPREDGNCEDCQCDKNKLLAEEKDCGCGEKCDRENCGSDR